MTTDDSPTRRNYLRRFATAGAIAGGGLIGVSSASADSQSGNRSSPAVDSEAIGLEAVCVDADHDAALFRVANESDQSAHLEWRSAPVEPGIEYLNCQTIRVVGDFAEVLVDARFLTDAGIGNVILHYGPVDGGAVYDIGDADGAPEDSIIASADAFREGTAVVPGGGDVSATNPSYSACQREVFGEAVDGPSTAPASETDRSADAADSNGGDCGRTSLVVPANETRCFAASGENGLVSVELFADDERIATGSSVTADQCSMPLWWWRWRQS